MLKNNIVPIVLHRVVESQSINFEDITIDSLKKILSKDSSSYITVKDLEYGLVESNKFLYMITFDDGYLSDFTIVFPLLKLLGINAIFFINTCNIGKPGFLDWQMIIEMNQNGNIFGSHGHNHLKMTEISMEESKFEFNKSKELYEINTGIEMSFFSFPYGLYNNNLLELSLKCGYSNCCISKHGIIHSLESLIPRNSINGSMSDSDISKILNPTGYIRAKWILEDATKNILKKIIREKNYLVLRRIVLKFF